MTFLRALEEQPNHAKAACQAASAIAREVEAFNAERRVKGLHACRMRIGLHTGPVAVGNVGFAGRVDYTIVGRTVNVAQALEQSGRHAMANSDVVILVSDATGRGAGDDFTFEPCPEINVSGATQALRLGDRERR